MHKRFSVLLSVVFLAVLVGGLVTWRYYGGGKNIEPKAEAPTDDALLASPDVSLEFGDDGDEGGTVVDARAAVKENIVGVWQSTDDGSFVREFKADGTVIDTYDGEPSATQKDTWTIFTKENPDKEFLGVLEDNTVYIKMKAASGNLYFRLLKLTPEVLELVHLDRGNTLHFVRK